MECKICNRSFKTQSQLDRHLKTKVHLAKVEERKSLPNLNRSLFMFQYKINILLKILLTGKILILDYQSKPGRSLLIQHIITMVPTKN